MCHGAKWRLDTIHEPVRPQGNKASAYVGVRRQAFLLRDTGSGLIVAKAQVGRGGLYLSDLNMIRCQ